MAAGFGTRREVVMFNDFVIVGPEDDPAGIATVPSAADAFRAIAKTQAPFVSRGDDSGTHALERSLWETAGVDPAGSWYQESGTGMGDTLGIANERRAYTVSDRGTFLAQRDRLDLRVLSEGDRALLNVYHAITVNPDNGRRVNVDGGTAFLAFLLSPEAQGAIAEFGVDRFGEPLFTPCAGNVCAVDSATPTASPAASPAP